ncbi:Thioredoxin H2-2 [Dendrobium catenatum]|uniref:Thioredoxin H2-2 n=1 Tax=Dendrobium catenatum TaxID=906689 RepID=A0A2I0WII4_9ASPA|nr:Thioredoxin H2-2 [Dendrobium catenatum]
MGSFFSTLLNPGAAAAAEEEGSAVVAVHSKESWNEHWTAHKNTNKLLVIDFSATWCGPCRFIEPTFKALAAKFTEASFVKIDVDELSICLLIEIHEVDQEVSQQWKVQAMPTFVLVKGGKEVARIVGAKEAELQGKVAQFIA